MTRVIQIAKGRDRAVAVVEEPHLRLLHRAPSIYALAHEAIANGAKLTALVQQKLSNLVLDYDPIYTGQSEWRILPPIDHPDEPVAASFPAQASLISAARATGRTCTPSPAKISPTA